MNYIWKREKNLVQSTLRNVISKHSLLFSNHNNELAKEITISYIMNLQKKSQSATS